MSYIFCHCKDYIKLAEEGLRSSKNAYNTYGPNRESVTGKQGEFSDSSREHLLNRTLDQEVTYQESTTQTSQKEGYSITTPGRYVDVVDQENIEFFVNTGLVIVSVAIPDPSDVAVGAILATRAGQYIGKVVSNGTEKVIQKLDGTIVRAGTQAFERLTAKFNLGKSSSNSGDVVGTEATPGVPNTAATTPNAPDLTPNGTGTVWDDVISTEDVYPGSVIPRSFELSTGDGTTVWMNPNATKHFAEYAQSVANDFPPNVVNLRVQEQFRSMQSAIETATKNGVPYNERITVDGWQLEIRPPRNEGQLPTVVHARPVGSEG